VATYGAEYLKRLLAAVERFERAFERWMETQIESDLRSSRGLFPTVHVKDGLDQGTVRELELDVAETAGAAARAPSLSDSRET
jgi:hypothetical protein